MVDDSNSNVHLDHDDILVGEGEVLKLIPQKNMSTSLTNLTPIRSLDDPIGSIKVSLLFRLFLLLRVGH